ncbi:MAG TPA: prenyltransferase/squalene oxidase repeat-containing protein [Acidobacteriota bacterium]
MPRRKFIKDAVFSTTGMLLPATGHAAARETVGSPSSGIDGSRIKNETFKFITRCAREDGGYAPSPDPAYQGNSDTAASDLAAVTYAATLARSAGWKLPREEVTVAFIQSHQKPDGSFINHGGKFDSKGELALLYNTTQGVVALRALGEKPKYRAVQVLDRFFTKNAFQQLPWYTTSFFPLFYAALDEPFPPEYRAAIRDHMVKSQAEDGYLGNHVAAAFHMAHFFRLIGEATPRAAAMVDRVLRDQRADGGWNIKQPDWDVHACFDAVFILRQLGGDSERCRAAIGKAAQWVLGCRNADGGFGHYSGWHSDMDAVYFQFGTLIQAKQIPGVDYDFPAGHVLSWGHVMKPGKKY